MSDATHRRLENKKTLDLTYFDPHWFRGVAFAPQLAPPSSATARRRLPAARLRNGCGRYFDRPPLQISERMGYIVKASKDGPRKDVL